MTEKQKIFADEYLIDLNATRAYKVAYPNVKNDAVAAAAAARLLRNVKVKNYIAEQMENCMCMRWIQKKSLSWPPEDSTRN